MTRSGTYPQEGDVGMRLWILGGKVIDSSLDFRAESEWVGTLEVYLWDEGTLMVEVESWGGKEYLVGKLEQDVDDEWEYSGSRAEVVIRGG